jgi:hypothetical protein
MPDEGTVLLVESDHAESDRLGRALESAGYEVITCPGPTAPGYACVGGREGYCPLVERTDVVVLDPWLAGDDYGVGTSADALVELYVSRGRTLILLGSVGWLDPFTGGHWSAWAIAPTRATSSRPSDRLLRQTDSCSVPSEIGYSTEPGVVVCRAR